VDIIDLKNATKNKPILNRKFLNNSCGIKNWEIIFSFNDQLSDAEKGVTLIFQLRKNDGELAVHSEVLNNDFLLSNSFQLAISYARKASFEDCQYRIIQQGKKMGTLETFHIIIFLPQDSGALRRGVDQIA
jgi:hypothetical protein